MAQVWDEDLKKSFCIHFFHLLWNVQFWVFFTFTVLCGAVSQWYFTPYVNDEKPRGDGETVRFQYPLFFCPEGCTIRT
jgi:hypothetical protein